MASIWKGSLAFGLVSIPVELRTAVREDHISFRLLHKEDQAPIKYERVCSADGETVPWDDIVKGYEFSKGKFVLMDDDDFTAAAPEASRNFEILDFVKQDEIDFRHFETPYFLVPSKGGDKAYALLREAIRNTSSIGIGTIIIRQKQHLAAVRVVGDALVMEIMRFANELVDAGEYTFPSDEHVRPQEVKMAEQLIATLAAPFEPEKYRDDYREKLMDVIRAKMKGKKIELPPEPKQEDTRVIDPMARLKESLDRGRQRPARRAAEPEPEPERKPARKSRRKLA